MSEDQALNEVPTDEQHVSVLEIASKMFKSVRGVRGKLRAIGLLILHWLP